MPAVSNRQTAVLGPLVSSSGRLEAEHAGGQGEGGHYDLDGVAGAEPAVLLAELFHHPPPLPLSIVSSYEICNRK